MPREQKVGFTILILIVGFAGAFCFRRQPEGEVALPALQNESELNQLIAEYRLRPFLPGIDTDEIRDSPGQLEQYLAMTVQAKKLASLENQEVPEPIQPVTTRSESPAGHLLQHKGNPVEIKDRLVSRAQTVSAKLPSNSLRGQSLTHIVQSGETLSGIAQKYFGSASRFYEIYEANQNILSGPNQLKPSMKLLIPFRRIAVKPKTVKEARNTTDPAVLSKKQTGRSKRKKTAGKESKHPNASGSEPTSLAGSVLPTSPKSGKKLFVPVRHSPFSSKAQPAKDIAKQPADRKLK